jgi:lambda repressor-like predicted transcriptional regulator
METQPDLSKLSVHELRSEQKRLEKFRNDLLAAFPDLETRDVSLTQRYEMGREGGERGEYGEFIKAKGQIDRLKLELIMRGQAPEVFASSQDPDTKKTNRECFVLPTLAKNGWSILDWAKNAGVDFHTANNFLKGKTRPYLSTRKKLAECLDIKVDELPS